MPDPLSPLTLVLGGASSGKSAFAERLVLNAGRAPVYIATAQGRDAGMKAKISRHQARRGPEWQLFEAPLSPRFDSFSTAQVVLLDCLTLWLSNVMAAGDDVESALTSLLLAVRGSAAPVVVVSNELGLGLVPETALGREFRDWQGAVNQRFAVAANRVVFVAAGLPLWLKGGANDL